MVLPESVAAAIHRKGAPGPRTDLAEHFLASVATVPGGEDPGRLARTQAGILRVLIAEGQADAVAAFLSPRPGLDAAFELRFTDPGVGSSTDFFGPDLEGAVREALRRAGRGCDVEVVAVANGLRRRVLRRSAGRPSALELVPPDPSAYDGSDDAAIAASREWQEAWSNSGPPADAPAGSSPTPAEAPSAWAPEEMPPAAAPAGAGASAAGASGPDLTAAVQDALSRVELDLDLPGIRTAVRESLADVALEVDLSSADGLASTVAEQVAEALSSEMVAGAATAVLIRRVEAVLQRMEIVLGSAESRQVEGWQVGELVQRVDRFVTLLESPPTHPEPGTSHVG